MRKLVVFIRELWKVINNFKKKKEAKLIDSFELVFIVTNNISDFIFN